MEFEILETLKISPSPSPFSFSQQQPITLPLSALDNDPSFRLHFRTLRLYNNPSPISATSDQCHVVIARSLARALFHFFPLAGSVVPLPDSRLAVLCSYGDAVHVTVAASPGRLGSLRVEPGSELLSRLALDLDGGDRVLALQVTRFACGGFTLGMCVHHAMCDGMGATKFLSAVAGFARGEEQVRVEPVWDRLSLLGPRKPPHVEVDLGEFLEFGGVESDDDRRVRELFHVTEVCLNRFRDRLKEETGLSFTAFEALGAFIWRARVKSNAIPSNEIIKFVYSMNISKLIYLQLPLGYYGNVCVPVYVKLTVEELLSQPISTTAKLIKNSKHNVTNEYVRSYVDFLDIHYSRGITAGNLVSGFTDWRHLGHSDVDFGWGSPRVVLPLSWRILGSSEPTFFLASDEEVDGRKEGFNVLACLKEKAVVGFRKEMETFNPEAFLTRLSNNL